MKLTSFIACSIIVCLADFGHFVSAVNLRDANQPGGSTPDATSNQKTPDSPPPDATANTEGKELPKLPSPASPPATPRHRMVGDFQKYVGAIGKVSAFESEVKDLWKLCDALKKTKRRWLPRPDSKNPNNDKKEDKDNDDKVEQIYWEFITAAGKYLDSAFNKEKENLKNELKNNLPEYESTYVGTKIEDIAKTYNDKLKQLAKRARIDTTLPTSFYNQLIKLKQLIAKSNTKVDGNSVADASQSGSSDDKVTAEQKNSNSMKNKLNELVNNAKEKGKKGGDFVKKLLGQHNNNNN